MITPSVQQPSVQQPFPLQPTPRTTLTRGRHRAVDDREALHAVLAQAWVAHVGIRMGSHPVVLPVLPAIDLEGPDEGGSLYLHGSVGAGWIRRLLASGDPVCVTVTELDGLVLARSAFHHSMNYRCAVVVGEPRQVSDPSEQVRALDLLVDQVVPGRSQHLRPHTRKELAATAILAVPLREASLKVRTGGPGDEAEDLVEPGWSGHVPVHRSLGLPIDSAEATAPLPEHVREFVERTGGMGASSSAG